jgi:hypothetical protein
LWFAKTSVGSFTHSLSISLDHSRWRWSSVNPLRCIGAYTHRRHSLHDSLSFVVHLESSKWSTLPKKILDLFSCSQGCSTSSTNPSCRLARPSPFHNLSGPKQPAHKSAGWHTCWWKSVPKVDADTTAPWKHYPPPKGIRPEAASETGGTLCCICYLR